MKKKGNKKTTTKVRKGEKKQAKNSFTKVHAFCEVLKSGPITHKDLIDRTIELFEKRNGKTLSRPTLEAYVRDYLGPLMIFGFVKKEDDTYQLIS